MGWKSFLMDCREEEAKHESDRIWISRVIEERSEKRRKENGIDNKKDDYMRYIYFKYTIYTILIIILLAILILTT
ncbi:MAG: hypothetical protein ABH956_03235 [Candidatus Nealsonbacteria bacterium]